MVWRESLSSLSMLLLEKNSGSSKLIHKVQKIEEITIDRQPNRTFLGFEIILLVLVVAES